MNKFYDQYKNLFEVSKLQKNRHFLVTESRGDGSFDSGVRRNPIIGDGILSNSKHLMRQNSLNTNTKKHYHQSLAQKQQQIQYKNLFNKFNKNNTHIYNCKFNNPQNYNQSSPTRVEKCYTQKAQQQSPATKQFNKVVLPRLKQYGEELDRKLKRFKTEDSYDSVQRVNDLDRTLKKYQSSGMSNSNKKNFYNNYQSQFYQRQSQLQMYATKRYFTDKKYSLKSNQNSQQNYKKYKHNNDNIFHNPNINNHYAGKPSNNIINFNQQPQSSPLSLSTPSILLNKSDIVVQSGNRNISRIKNNRSVVFDNPQEEQIRYRHDKVVGYGKDGKRVRFVGVDQGDGASTVSMRQRNNRKNEKALMSEYKQSFKDYSPASKDRMIKEFEERVRREQEKDKRQQQVFRPFHLKGKALLGNDRPNGIVNSFHHKNIDPQQNYISKLDSKFQQQQREPYNKNINQDFHHRQKYQPTNNKNTNTISPNQNSPNSKPSQVFGYDIARQRYQQRIKSPTLHQIHQKKQIQGILFSQYQNSYAFINKRMQDIKNFNNYYHHTALNSYKKAIMKRLDNKRDIQNRRKKLAKLLLNTG